MDFDREYHRPRRPDTPDDFTDCNVQALVEGRRKTAAPRPVLSETDRVILQCREAVANVDRVIAECRKPLTRRAEDWHYDSQGYCDNPGRGY